MSRAPAVFPRDLSQSFRVFRVSAWTTAKLFARHPLPWFLTLATGVLLGLFRGFAIRAPLGIHFLPELVASSLVLLCWLAALIVLPFLYDRASGYWSQLPDHAFPSSRTPLVAGIAGGGALGLGLLSATLVCLVFVLQRTHQSVPTSEALVAFVAGWSGGVSLFFWALLLSRWLRRPTVLCLTLVLVLVDLTPALLPALPRWLPLEWLFLPVSPSDLLSDQPYEMGILTETLLWNGLYCLGLLLLLPGSWGSRSPL